jgi:hypothetical protein
MSEHTPGPWVSRDVGDDQDADFGQWVVEIPETAGNTVIRLWFGDMESNTGEDIANARIVAASPDLLAACEAIYRVAEDAFLPGPVHISISERDQLRDAIAKARGEDTTAVEG